MAEDTSGDYDVMELSKAVELICKQAKDVHINDISINTLAEQEKKPIWDPNYYTKITRNELEYILRSKNSKTTIPLLDERLKILHDVGEILLKKYQGTFMECIKLSEYDANKLLKLLFDEFESYRDEVIYNGKKVRFLCKARSLVADIWGIPENKFNLDTRNMISTTFIDYRIPLLLFRFRILSYSDTLLKRFENNEPLEFGSREEIEIRGCSLFVMQKICNEVHNRINQRYKADERILKIKSLDIPVMVDNCFLRMMFYDNISFQQSPFHYIKTLHY
ncbi:queuosine salvage protein-like isoform X3 [Nylanderia fulva]|uniref:queuosine salvage protein-like isoform X3 n=1 Tax=Nylanderia fulva TaxID=613905 RepID=UPI0010FB8C3F|nr:queuosine salvage protein-like isoform X3 [Nylanderia fulva]